MENTKGEMIRVRVPGQVKADLKNKVEELGGQSSLSYVVRLALELYLYGKPVAGAAPANGDK